MKKRFLKIGFTVVLAMITSVALSSCSNDANAENDNIEQTEKDADTGPENDHKCEDSKCEEGKCATG